MMQLPCAALAALFLVVSLTARAQSQDEMETVLVTGEQPGPGLWKVSRDGHVMWVLGSIGEVPDTIKWRTKEMETRISESQEVLYPGWPSVNLDVSAFELLTLVPSAFRTAKNPDGAMLKDVLAPEAYATWLRLRKKYLNDDDDVEKYRPMIAEDKLNTAIGKTAMKGMRFVQVDSVVKKAARKHNVPIHELPWVKHKIKVEKPRAILKAARNMDLAEGECVGRNLVRIENADAAGLLKYDVAMTNAWATGDLDALRAKTAPAVDLQREDCGTVALDAAMERAAAGQPTEISRGLGLIKQQEGLHKIASAEAERNWLEAVEAALAKNVSTFAVLPMNLMTNQYVYLAKLKAKGYAVESPDEQRDSRELRDSQGLSPHNGNAGQGPASEK